MLASTGGTLSDPLAILQRHYVDRLAAAQECTRAGGGVVGLVGSVAPPELVLAAGRFPLLIAAEPHRPTPTGDRYMEESGYSWEVRSIFDRAAAGELRFLELLVVSRVYHEVYYYLKEIVRLGEGPDVPPLHMFDLMQSQRDAVRAYGLGRVEDLRDRLARLAGQPIEEAALRAAIALTNRKRQLVRRLLELRAQSALDGVTALQVIGAGSFMHPAQYVDALADYLESVQPDPTLAIRPRLLVLPSESLYHVELHALLERAGGLVVAEDDWCGSRSVGSDIPDADSPLTAIFEKYWLDCPTAEVSPRQAREAWFLDQVERRTADGVVFYVPPSDHRFGWDYPRLKATLDASGMPSLLIRQDVLEPSGREQAGTLSEQFIGALPPPPRGER